MDGSKEAYYYFIASFFTCESYFVFMFNFKLCIIFRLFVFNLFSSNFNIFGLYMNVLSSGVIYAYCSWQIFFVFNND